MHRRRFLTAVGGTTAVAVSGCLSFPRGDSAPEYPRGSLYVYNTSQSSITVAVETVDHDPPASVETTVTAGEHIVEREFVTADPGTTVTLAARIGETGETTFEFLPAGDDSGDSPEYARLTIRNAVEESAEWSARKGT
ncbi:MAG: hypothetical protein ACI8XM_000034 [Haloarculaceae archaeon]|jgi:hypothetical protein